MQSNTRNRGFASMDAEKQREIARKGGRAAHEKGTAHEFTSDEARAAGRKGGERVSADRHHMSRIGRMGGKNSAGRRQTPRSSPPDAGSLSSEADSGGHHHAQSAASADTGSGIGHGERGGVGHQH